MSARGFRPVFLTATCAGAALGCYLVSLNVASERASLEQVETKIVLAQRDIRLLQTEIGTRGRLAQLERWNVRVLALSAPSADQFVDGGFALARLVRPERKIAVETPIVLASAPAPQPQHAPLEEGERHVGGAGATSAADLLLEASLKTGKSATAESDAARPAVSQSVASAGTGKKSAADKKAGDKPDRSAKAPVTKRVQTAKNDPLAPLPDRSGTSATAKDFGQAR